MELTQVVRLLALVDQVEVVVVLLPRHLVALVTKVVFHPQKVMPAVPDLAVQVVHPVPICQVEAAVVPEAAVVELQQHL